MSSDKALNRTTPKSNHCPEKWAGTHQKQVVNPETCLCAAYGARRGILNPTETTSNQPLARIVPNERRVNWW